MQALRLHEVIQRVVRWHNRHPLARRINASQVHSIGEVVLPFAADRPWSAPGVPPRVPTGAAPPPPEPQVPPPVLHDAVDAPAEADPAEVPDLDALADDLLTPDAARPAAGDVPDLADDAGEPPPQAVALSDDASRDAADAPVQATADDPPTADIDLSTDEAALPADEVEAAAADDPAELPPAPPADGPADEPAERAEPAEVAPVPDLADDDAASQALLAAHEAALSAPTDLPPAPPQVLSPSVPPTSPAEVDLDLAAAQAEAPTLQPSLAEVVERRAAARTAAASAAPRGPRQWWTRLCQALRGRPADMPRLKAAFNRKLFWPSNPATVARWAQRHAHAQPLAPEDWLHRVVEADPAQRTQLRRQGQVHGIELHALTAAIGVGDRRIRLLVGTDGSILGPRAYSRARVASACTVLLACLLGLGWGLRPSGTTAPADGAALAARAASAASAPVAVVEAAASAAPAASDAASATPAATRLANATPAEPADHAASTATPHDTVPATLAHGAAPQPSAPALPAQVAAAASAALASAAPAADAAPVASAPFGRIRPGLSDEAKLAAKAESDRLRGGPSQSAAPAPAPLPVYALVSPPNRERRVAMGHLTIMRRAGNRLPPPTPDHGELMQHQGEWRAAWWPFASLADAERARVMLAGRGLRAEVVEF